MIMPAAKTLLHGLAIVLHDPQMIIDGDTVMRERHARPQRIGREWRRCQRDRAARFRRRQPGGAAFVQRQIAGRDSRRVELAYRRFQRRRIEPKRGRERCDAIGPDRRQRRRQRSCQHLARPGSNRRSGPDIPRCGRPSAQNASCARPRLRRESVLPLRSTTMPCGIAVMRVTIPPSNFGPRASTATMWACADIADRFRTGIEQQAQHRAGIIGRAADHEIVGGRSKTFAQPAEIGLMAAGAHHQCLRADALDLAVMPDIGGAIAIRHRTQAPRTSLS